MKRWTDAEIEWMAYKRRTPAKVTLPPMPWRKPAAADMTVEEFAAELARIKHDALYIDTTAAGRDAAKHTRSYRNARRGAFGKWH